MRQLRLRPLVVSVLAAVVVTAAAVPGASAADPQLIVVMYQGFVLEGDDVRVLGDVRNDGGRVTGQASAGGTGRLVVRFP